MENYFKFKEPNPDLVYLDSAASSQVFFRVVQKLFEHYLYGHTNIKRSDCKIAKIANEEFEQTRKLAAKFFNVESEKEIIFTHGATEGINMLALGLKHLLKSGDNIVLTELEHHSNIMPWQKIGFELGVEIRFIPYDFSKQNLDYDKLNLIDEKTKIVSFTHTSNALGVKTEISKIVGKAKEVGALTILDACQAVAHEKIDVRELKVDFMVMSAHKMYGPNAVGVLYGKEESLEKVESIILGGGTPKTLNLNNNTLDELPFRLEAGTPAVAEIIAFAEVFKIFEEIGLQKIIDHSREVNSFLYDKLIEIPKIKIFNNDRFSPIQSFSVEGLDHYDLSAFLGEKDICVRAGRLCAAPIIEKIGEKGVIRVSTGMYTTRGEIEKFISELKNIIEKYAK